MAYGNKYTLTFADAQDREHVVYLDLEGYAAGVTALTPSENPLIWSAGANRGDVFATLMPSSVELNLIVTDSTLFSDIAGDGEFAWLLRWEIDSTEVWRGHVLTDELTQPLDIPGQLTVRAICGLVTLENIEWTPASTTRQVMMPLVADALGDLAHGLSIRSVANWHAYNGGAAVTGNSYARYEILPKNYRNSENLAYASSAMVLANLSGLFLSTLVQANGKWNLVQREAITGASYTANVYDSTGAYDTTEAVSRLQIDTATAILLYGGQLSAARAYSGAETRYSHGDLGFQVFDNASFQTWSGGVPTSWTEIDEHTVTAPNTGDILTQVETGYTQATNPLGQTYRESTLYGVEIAGTENAGYEIDAASSAKVGLMQNGQVTTASGSSIEIGFSVKIQNMANSFLGPRPAFWSLWLNTAGTDYYWDDKNQAWTSGTLPTHTAGGVTETVAAAAKNRINVSVDAAFKPYVFAVTATPADGVLRLVLYNVVGIYSGDAGLSIIYDEVAVKILGDSDYSNGTARTTVTDAATPGRSIYDTGTYLSGQGPTIYHQRAITFSSGTAATDWKAGAYAGAEAASAETLERVRCEQALVALGAPPKRLRAGFELTSGTYWPHEALLLDSVGYTCSSLAHNARFCQYEGEWVEQRAHSFTPTEEVTVIDAWIDPGMDDLFENPDDIGPGDVYVPPDPGAGTKDWKNTDNPVANPRVETFSGSFAQNLSVGDNPVSTERLSIRSDTGDTAIRLDTGVGGGGVWILGIDSSDSNSFKITEGTALGYAPDAGAGDRVKIDGDGNFTINPLFGGTSYNFKLGSANDSDGDAYLVLPSGTTTSAGYYSSSKLRFEGHFWTGVADSQNHIELQLVNESAANDDAVFRMLAVSGNGWDFDIDDGSFGPYAEYRLPGVDGTANQILQTDGLGVVSWATIAAGVTTLDGLSDVTITSVATGEILVYTGAAWENQTWVEYGPDVDGLSGYGTIGNAWMWGSTAAFQSVTVANTAITLAAMESEAGSPFKDSPTLAFTGEWYDVATTTVNGSIKLNMTSAAADGYQMDIATTSFTLALKETGVAAWSGSSLTVGGTAVSLAGHTHAASAITSGTLVHEQGGLEADVSAYNGLVKISGGTTSAVTDNSSNWDTAYGWGDPSGVYVPIAGASNITGAKTFTAATPADTPSPLTASSPITYWQGSWYDGVGLATEYRNGFIQFVVSDDDPATYYTRIVSDSNTLLLGGSSTDLTWNGTAISLAGHAHAASDITSGTLGVALGGTGLATVTAFGMLVGNATTALTVVSPNITTTRKFLMQQGDGAASANPLWDVVTAADIFGADPGADRIAFWDDSGSAGGWLSLSGLGISGTTLTADFAYTSVTPGTFTPDKILVAVINGVSYQIPVEAV